MGLRIKKENVYFAITRFLNDGKLIKIG